MLGLGLGSPLQERHGHTGGSSVEGHPEVGTLEHMMHEETHKSWLVQPGKKGSGERAVFHSLNGRYRKVRARLLLGVQRKRISDSRPK